MCTLENGRAAANMLSGLKTDLEYNQVPAIQIKPVICALLGMLHVRYRSGLSIEAVHHMPASLFRGTMSRLHAAGWHMHASSEQTDTKLPWSWTSDVCRGQEDAVWLQILSPVGASS